MFTEHSITQWPDLNVVERTLLHRCLGLVYIYHGTVVGQGKR